MSTYIRLTDYKDSDSKEQGFFNSENRYEDNNEYLNFKNSIDFIFYICYN